MRNRVNFRQLEAFRAVILTGSFTAAAGHLNITQPAVSKLIAELEHTLGVMLFDRSGANIKPTNEANLIFAESQKIHSGLDRLLDVAAMAASQSEEIIKCAALPIYADTVAPKLIADHRENAPDVQFMLDSMRHDEVIKALLTEEIDVAITSTPTGLDTLIEYGEGEERAVLIAPKASDFSDMSEISLNDLRAAPFIAFPPSCPFRQTLDQHFAAESFTPNQIMMARAPSAVCRLVDLGLGVSIIQASALDAYQGALHKLELRESFSWCYGLVTKRGRQLPTHITRFLETAAL